MATRERCITMPPEYRLYLHCTIVVGAVFATSSPEAGFMMATLDEARRLRRERS